MKKIILFFVVITSFQAFSQKYPQNYFRSPLDIPLVLSGTFGELRNNHFHSGIDIKTKQRNGLKVYAVADGYVSRIRVALWGYGKVIYVTHDNGYTSVYAHLSKFGKGIQEFVKSVQYKKEQYETGNIYLKPGEINVTKGQIIAYSGSTGGFVAPHLHYELRDSKTEHIINPLLFGIKVKDTIKPRIQKLMAYTLDNTARINQSDKNQVLAIKRVRDGEYITNRILASGRIGFGINVYDKLNNAHNKNGVYSIEMLVNDKRVYYHDVETFSFRESKYINLLIDYPHYYKFKNRVQKTHVVKGNDLSIYENLIDKGAITVDDGMNYTVKIIATDITGNRSTVKIPIKGTSSNSIFKRPKDTTAYKIVATQFHKFQKDGITIAFPKNTLYEDVYLDFDVKDSIATIHEPSIPLDKKFTLTFDVTKYSEAEKERMFIAKIVNKKYVNYQNTKKKKNKFYTTTKTLGRYTLASDNQKPKIYNLNFRNNQWITNKDQIRVYISDKGSGIKSYRATLDDEWILMEYDLKKKKLVYNFSDKKLVGSKHSFKIVVSDNVGNTNTLSATFYKK
ncbi:M23 family metallopeptidase [Flavobacteriaceae bacterium S356]|uniref:M23 family metallopeptidase n=1 Tax=Asprobacillus argus TaxID=3076534 RepID=A0ABU3LFJ5_9FLAO|nr:M23 family metallopeptidase [Flavobacteriaceae bacterium S356]